LCGIFHFRVVYKIQGNLILLNDTDEEDAGQRPAGMTDFYNANFLPKCKKVFLARVFVFWYDKKEVKI